ncbi:MAG TPA: L,D-transpeptidase family protein [Afifellaceae bacterium]|nr:L,D-transpeptidase family protein [Afifellaceae bacterium]
MVKLPKLMHMKRAGMLAVAGVSLMLVSGCNQLANIPKHLRPLSSGAKMALEQKGMEETSPILVRIFKQESELEVWKQVKATGKYALFKTYDICRWSGEVGPKYREGDRQAPEGFYTITPALMNPNSSYHLSFNLGYPNSFDRAHGRTGSHLMVHGACSSRGCYSMDDEQIQEIYTLARLAFQGGQRSFQVQAFPFRMTPANLAASRKSPHYEFWKMLKEGHDHFEVTGMPPKVDVCSKRYVFNAVAQEGVKFNPTGDCPEMTVAEPIRLAVQEREMRDEEKELKIVARLEAREKRRGPLNSIFGVDTAVAEASPAPQSVPQSIPPIRSAPTAVAVASDPAPKPAEPEVAETLPESRPASEGSSVATAYTLDDDSDSDSFITGLMKRIW